MLKNAFFYRLTERLGTNQLNDAFAKGKFQSGGTAQAQTLGFESLAPGLDLAHQVPITVAGKADALVAGAIRVDKRTIPGSGLKKLVQDRAREIERRQGYKPGRKQLREIKEALIDELLPKVVPASKTVPLYFWKEFVVVDASNAATADMALGLLGKVLDQFPLEMYEFRLSPSVAMTTWLVHEPPEKFTVDQEAEMHASGESRAKIRWQNESVDGAQASQYANDGKVCVKLAMTWSDRVSFVLNERGNLTKIKALDVLKQDAPQYADDQEAFDGDLSLMGAEFAGLLGDLLVALDAANVGEAQA